MTEFLLGFIIGNARGDCICEIVYSYVVLPEARALSQTEKE